MFENYFKIAWRNLWRNRVFSIIKILGLSIGLTVCMLILLYTKDELSYDQFHENKSQIFRIIQAFQIGKEPTQVIATTNSIMGETFAKEIPGIQQYIRVNGANVTVKKGSEVVTEKPLCVDENFLSVFTFPLLRGSTTTALKDPHSVVLSKDMAKKYFGITDVIGKTMQLKIDNEFENFTVTAVAENSPENSSLKAGMLLPYKWYEKYNNNVEWVGGSINGFVLVSPQQSIKTIVSKMQAVFDKNSKDQLLELKQKQDLTINIKLDLQPLTDIHLSRKAGPENGMSDGSNPVYSYVLTCIAIFILIIACINFINLAVAQSLKRSKEIGIRKVVGSTRGQLIKQFLVESFVVALVAFILAIALTVILLPFFNQLANKKLNLAYLSDGYLYVGYFVLLMVTAFVSGFYPSLVLSAFRPVKALYSRQKLTNRNYLTKGLIVLQFTLAIFLIIGTLTVNSQLDFLLHKDLGFDSKGMVRLNIPVNNSSNNLPDLFRNELLNNRNIIAVAAKNGGRSISGMKANGKKLTIEDNRVDDQYFPAFKIPFVAGRNFSADYPSDISSSVIINESFAKEAGWKASEAVGKIVFNHDDKNSPMTIVGVVKDYHFLSLKEKISPAFFSMDTTFNYGEIWVKIGSKDVPKTLALLQNTFSRLVPYYPYTYQFMDDLNAKNYEMETKWKQIISIASGLFIFISCIGLLGLVILSIEQRTKEIGIRKVLGAAVSKILILISREFVVLISIAFLIAVPVGYYFTDKWLQAFAYRINVGWWIFAIAGLGTLLVALLTLSFQAIRAATANPVKSLRTE